MSSNRYGEKKATVDWLSILIYVALLVFGAFNIYSANSTPGRSFIFDFKMEYGKQLIWIGISLILIFMIMLTDPGFFEIAAYVIYGAIILMLIGVLTTGSLVHSSKSWFAIGAFKIQPSEFAKYATALAVAKYLGTFGNSFSGRKNILITVGFILLPMALTILQNDTGSALVFAAFFFALFREGLSGWLLILGSCLIAIFIFTIIYNSLFLLSIIFVLALTVALIARKYRQVIWICVGVFVLSAGFIFSVDYLFSKVLQSHQQQRILVTLNQDVDEFYARKKKEFSLFKVEEKAVKKGSKRDYAYNVRQSKISIGAGQWIGNGFNKGTQTKAKLVPEQHTDFIFCTVGEEYGFIGSGIFIMVYLFFIGRLYYLAERQKTIFSRVYGYCTASILFFHFFVNVGMAIGVLPVIGIPLPFMSYGGSSLFSFSMMLFTFLKLDSNRVNEVSRAY